MIDIENIEYEIAKRPWKYNIDEVRVFAERCNRAPPDVYYFDNIEIPGQDGKIRVRIEKINSKLCEFSIVPKSRL